MESCGLWECDEAADALFMQGVAVSEWAAALDDSLKKGSPKKGGSRAKKDKPEHIRRQPKAKLASKPSKTSPRGGASGSGQPEALIPKP